MNLGMMQHIKPPENPKRKRPNRIVYKFKYIVIPAPIIPTIKLTYKARLLPIMISLPPVSAPKAPPKIIIEPIKAS